MPRQLGKVFLQHMCTKRLDVQADAHCLHLLCFAWGQASPAELPNLCRVGDGDCGTTLAQGARGIKADCGRRYPLNDAAATMAAVAQTVGHSMGGSSGALYQIFFIALAGELATFTVLTITL